MISCSRSKAPKKMRAQESLQEEGISYPRLRVAKVHSFKARMNYHNKNGYDDVMVYENRDEFVSQDLIRRHVLLSMKKDKDISLAKNLENTFYLSNFTLAQTFPTKLMSESFYDNRGEIQASVTFENPGQRITKLHYQLGYFKDRDFVLLGQETFVNSIFNSCVCFDGGYQALIEHN